MVKVSKALKLYTHTHTHTQVYLVDKKKRGDTI